MSDVDDAIELCAGSSRLVEILEGREAEAAVSIKAIKDDDKWRRTIVSPRHLITNGRTVEKSTDKIGKKA